MKEKYFIYKNVWDLKIKNSSIYLSVKKKLKPTKIKTGPYPSFATDNMPMLLAVLTTVPGKSEITETIYSNRYMAAPELVRMGALINIKGNKQQLLELKN